MAGSVSTSAEPAATAHDFVTMTIAGQLFGVPVSQVHDVLSVPRLTRIPQAPPEVAGALNLRGRIVTAIDLRARLSLPARTAQETPMSIVVEHANESYSLMVDQVGEVLSLPAAAFEANPPTLDPRWRDVSNGIYRLEGQLLVVLDVQRVLGFAVRPVA